ncbi:MAG: hypothetical protein QM770_21935 [Tepidisphaeraceae bacterium]
MNNTPRPLSSKVRLNTVRVERGERRVRQAAIVTVVGLTAAATTGIYADSARAEQIAAENRASAVILASLLQDAPANPAEALAAAKTQFDAKQYDEALATLQSIKTDGLDDAQKASLSSLLAEVTPAAEARKAARVAFEEGNQAAASGDTVTALTKLTAARDNAYADEATVAKAKEQLNVVADPAKLQEVYKSAVADAGSGNADAAKAKFIALAAVGYTDPSGKSPADYLNDMNAGAAAAAVAAPVAPAATNDSALAKKAYGLAVTQYRKGDWISARSNFQLAANKGYKAGLFETSPQDYLAKMDQKERADNARAAKALEAAPAVAVAPVAETTPAVATDTPTPSPVATAVTEPTPTPTPAITEPTPTPTPTPVAVEPTPTPTPTPAVTEPTPVAVAPATEPTSELRTALQAEQVKAADAKFRAQQLVASASAALAAGRNEEAKQQFDAALKLDPTNLEAKTGYDQAVDRTGTGAPTDLATQMRQRIEGERQAIQWNFNTSIAQANDAMAKNDYEAATNALQRARNARNSNPSIFNDAEIREFDASIASKGAEIDSKRTAFDAEQKRIANEQAIAGANEKAREAEIQKRRTVEGLIKQARQLTDQRKYTEAIGVVDQNPHDRPDERLRHRRQAAAVGPQAAHGSAQDRREDHAEHHPAAQLRRRSPHADPGPAHLPDRLAGHLGPA